MKAVIAGAIYHARFALASRVFAPDVSGIRSGTLIFPGLGTHIFPGLGTLIFPGLGTLIFRPPGSSEMRVPNFSGQP